MSIFVPILTNNLENFNKHLNNIIAGVLAIATQIFVVIRMGFDKSLILFAHFEKLHICMIIELVRLFIAVLMLFEFAHSINSVVRHLHYSESQKKTIIKIIVSSAAKYNVDR